MNGLDGGKPFGATGKPGTCLWCGDKLKHGTVTADESQRDDPTYKSVAPHYATVRAARSGSYQDDKFCGLRCGYRFGLRMAELGKRLKARR